MVNIKEIAKMAGVSISSVSRVINKRAGVNIENRKKIERIIKETAYRPNLLARELLQKKTNIIGIILPAIHSYYAERIAGLTDVCYANKYGVMIASSRENMKEEINNFNLFYEKQVDGIVFFVSSITPEHEKLLKDISKKIPVIMVGHEITGLDIPAVIQDNYQGGRKAVEFLIENGHSKIGIICGPTENFSAQQRFSAYLDVMKEHNLKPPKEYISQGTFTLPSGYIAMKEILEKSEEIPTAIFAINDMMAMGAVKAILEKGYRVPGDISIVGFDNVVLAEYFNPALTTIHQNHYEIGKQAGELLMEYLRNKEVPVKRLILEQRLIERDSVRRI